MNTEMAYLLGMLCGNGEIIRQNNETTFSIEIPHKKLMTESGQDVQIYVQASIANIRNILEPLVGASMSYVQNKSVTYIRFSKPNTDYLTREIIRFIGDATGHETIRISEEVFDFTTDEKLIFLRGFADVTGYIRRSNYFFYKYKHRVYLEIPRNWELVIEISNLLKSVGVPVHTIDWGHPNMRDPQRKKYDEGKLDFWKKEHQIKIFANEFVKIGFAVIHKMQSLEMFADELVHGYRVNGKDASRETGRFYWEGRKILKNKENHPSVNDLFIPAKIRGKQYKSWKDIANDLGYYE